VNPSAEWKNGGVYNYDLACHQGENDSLVIICMAGSYYGARDEYPKKKKKKKKKKKMAKNIKTQIKYNKKKKKY